MLLRNRMLMGGYVKPPILTLGTGPGTITPNAGGYALSGFANTCFAYLDAPKTSGKWYWEVVVDGSYVLPGVADDVGTAADYGGYPSTNAGLYPISSMALWVDGGWTGGSVGAAWSLAAAATSDVLGLALDLDSAPKTLSVYLNGVLGGVISWTGGPTSLWPMFGFQFGPSTQVNLGPSGCAYPRPAGFTHL